MKAYRWGPLEPALSQAVDWLMRARCTEGRPAVLRIGPGAEEGLAFGRYQTIPNLLRRKRAVQRRVTGGRLIPIGPGVLEVTVAAPRLTDLTAEGTPIGAELLLNRAVRGALRGLERLGLAVVYPGRDLITLKRRAVGHLAFDIDEEARPLVQLHLAWRTPLAEAARRLEAAGAPPEGRADLLSPEGCVTLDEALGGAVGLEEVEAALLEGFAQHVGAPLRSEPAPGELMAQAEALVGELFSREGWLADRTPPADLDRRVRIASQLGSFQVALRLDEEGRIGEARLAGEILAGAPCIAALEAALKGCPAEPSEVARRVDLVLDTPPHILLGLGPRRTIVDAILKAAAQPPKT